MAGFRDKRFVMCGSLARHSVSTAYNYGIMSPKTRVLLKSSFDVLSVKLFSSVYHV
jgi:hypothetical protein